MSKQLETPKLTRLFSYDAHVVDLFPFVGWTLPFRKDCNGIIKVISEKGSSGIYVTNIEDFNKDKQAYIAADKSSNFEPLVLRGMQFQTWVNIGLIFTSYTYIPGSMSSGGYASYGLK